MKPVNVRLWTTIGAVVGAFLMPSTWLLLVAVAVGGQLASAVDSLGGTDAAEGGITFDPDAGEFVPAEPAPEVDAPTPWWIIAGLVVAAIVTVLSAVFFAWLGRRAALAHNARLTDRLHEALDASG